MAYTAPRSLEESGQGHDDKTTTPSQRSAGWRGLWLLLAKWQHFDTHLNVLGNKASRLHAEHERLFVQVVWCCCIVHDTVGPWNAKLFFFGSSGFVECGRTPSHLLSLNKAVVDRNFVLSATASRAHPHRLQARSKSRERHASLRNPR